MTATKALLAVCRVTRYCIHFAFSNATIRRIPRVMSQVGDLFDVRCSLLGLQKLGSLKVGLDLSITFHQCS